MKKLIIFTLASMLAAASTVVILQYQNPRIQTVVMTDTVTLQPPTALPIEDTILELLMKHGCVLPNVALAQFRIETGHFTSAIFLENNNVAGIRTSRSDLVQGYNRDHCVYATLEDCIMDYIHIQNNYLIAIDGYYAESEEYVGMIKGMRK